MQDEQQLHSRIDFAWISKAKAIELLKKQNSIKSIAKKLNVSMPYVASYISAAKALNKFPELQNESTLVAMIAKLKQLKQKSTIPNFKLCDIQLVRRKRISVFKRIFRLILNRLHITQKI